MRGLLPFFCCVLALPAQALQVAVPSDVLADYQRWLGGRDVLTLQAFSGEGVRRDVVEVALFAQALKQGCDVDEIEWVSVDSYPRTLYMLRQGSVDAAATTLWRSDIQANGLQVSPAAIEDGQFVAALYSSSSRYVEISQPEQLSALRAVSSPHWSKDWDVLQRMPFAEVLAVNDWATMVRWVASGKADVLLAPMVASDPPEWRSGDIKLVPLTGVRVALAGSRHFSFAPGQALSGCFSEGLSTLKQRGVIQAAYEQSGFWRRDFMRWPIMGR